MRTLHLETLYVDIVARARPFYTTMTDVQRRFENIHRMFQRTGALADALGQKLSALALHIQTLTSSIAALATTDLKNLVAVGESLRLFGAKMSTVGFKNILQPELLTNLGRFPGVVRELNSVANADLSGIVGIAEQLRLFGARVGMVGFQNLLKPEFANLGNLGSVGTSLRLFSNSIAGVDSGQLIRLVDIGNYLNEFGGRMGLAGVRNLFSLNLDTLPPIARNLRSFTHAIAGVDGNQLRRLVTIADHLNNFGASLDRIGVLNLLTVPTANLPAVGRHLRNLSASLSGLTASNFQPLVDIGNVLNEAGGRFRLTGVTRLLSIDFTPLRSMGTSLRSLSRSTVGLSLSHLPQVMRELGVFLRSADRVLSNAPLANINANLAATTQMARSINTLVRSLNGLQNLNFPAINANLTQLSTLMSTFAAGVGNVNVNNLNAVTNALNAARAAARGVGGGGPGGGRGNILTRTPILGGGGAAHAAGFAITANKFAFEFQMLRFGMLGFGLASTIAFARFDDAVTRSLSVIRGATPQMRRELEQLVFSVVRAGQSISSATELVEGFQSLVQSGLSFQEAKQFLLPLDQLRMVAGEGTEMREIAAMISTVRHNWNLAGSDIARVSDIIVRGSQLSRSTVEQFGEALARVAPTAAGLNLSLEDTASALAMLGQAGLHGSEAATGLARFLNVLETGAVRNEGAWMQFFGRNIVFDQMGNLRAIPDIIDDIRQRMAGLNQAQRRSMMMELGLGEAGGTGLTRTLNAFMNAPRERFGEFVGQLRNAGGSLNEMASLMVLSFGRQMMVLWNNIKTFAITVGQLLVPALMVLRTALMAVTQAWTLIPQPIKNFAGALLVAIPLVYALGRAILFVALGGIQGLIASIGANAAAFVAFFASPVTWVVLLTTAIIALASGTEAGLAALKDMGSSLAGLQESFGMLLSAVVEVLAPLMQIFSILAVPAVYVLAVALKAVAAVLGVVARMVDALPSWLKSAVTWTIAFAVAARFLGIGLLAVKAHLLGLTLAGTAAKIGLITASFWAWARATGAVALNMTFLLGKLLLMLGMLDIIVSMAGGESIIDAGLGLGNRRQSGRADFPNALVRNTPNWLLNIGRTIGMIPSPATSPPSTTMGPPRPPMPWSPAIQDAWIHERWGIGPPGSVGLNQPIIGGTYGTFNPAMMELEGPGGLSRGTTEPIQTFQVSDNQTHRILTDWREEGGGLGD